MAVGNDSLVDSPESKNLLEEYDVISNVNSSDLSIPLSYESYRWFVAEINRIGAISHHATKRSLYSDVAK